MTSWPVLDSLPRAEVDALLASARRRTFDRGEVLFHHGDPADALHLLAVGHVAVRVRTPQGDQAILNVLGPGSSFGELALLGSHPHRTATVNALDLCETYAVRRQQFDRLRVLHPAINDFLFATLADQVSQLSEHLLEVLFVPTRQRVIRRLLMLAETFDGPIPLTQGDIALMSGTTRPTANESLRQLERTGAISIGRGRIEVRDRDQLASRLSSVTET